MANLRLTCFLLLQLIGSCYVAATSLHSRGLTNADRLKRGLPLKSPVFRRGTPTRRDSSPSNVPVLTTYTGSIQVLNADTGSPLGWLGQYGQIEATQSTNPLEIQFSAYPGFTSGLIGKCLSCLNTPNFGLTIVKGGTASEPYHRSSAYLYNVGPATAAYSDDFYQYWTQVLAELRMGVDEAEGARVYDIDHRCKHVSELESDT
ncbi:hypothetical protein DL96DRAFT_1780914 [Flagelloscypha sp. PMI_526]|nr:hypothetical protein DL96DRAFT_1780914 [Flagelloscypha sp. PMI_526]